MTDFAEFHAALEAAQSDPHGGKVQIPVCLAVRIAAALPAEKPKRQMTIASFCAMTCAEGGFHVFLTEREGVNIASAEAATAFVREYCQIESRKELNVEGPARDKWLSLKASYDGWLRT